MVLRRHFKRVYVGLAPPLATLARLLPLPLGGEGSRYTNNSTYTVEVFHE